MDYCPVCGSDAIEWGDVSTYRDGDKELHLRQDCCCEACEGSWVEHFRFLRVELINPRKE